MSDDDSFHSGSRAESPDSSAADEEGSPSPSSSTATPPPIVTQGAATTKQQASKEALSAGGFNIVTKKSTGPSAGASNTSAKQPAAASSVKPPAAANAGAGQEPPEEAASEAPAKPSNSSRSHAARAADTHAKIVTWRSIADRTIALLMGLAVRLLAAFVGSRPYTVPLPVSGLETADWNAKIASLDSHSEAFFEMTQHIAQKSTDAATAKQVIDMAKKAQSLLHQVHAGISIASVTQANFSNIDFASNAVTNAIDLRSMLDSLPPESSCADTNCLNSYCRLTIEITLRAVLTFANTDSSKSTLKEFTKGQLDDLVGPVPPLNYDVVRQAATAHRSGSISSEPYASTPPRILKLSSRFTGTSDSDPKSLLEDSPEARADLLLVIKAIRQHHGQSNDVASLLDFKFNRGGVSITATIAKQLYARGLISSGERILRLLYAVDSEGSTGLARSITALGDSVEYLPTEASNFVITNVDDLSKLMGCEAFRGSVTGIPDINKHIPSGQEPAFQLAVLNALATGDISRRTSKFEKTSGDYEIILKSTQLLSSLLENLVLLFRQSASLDGDPFGTTSKKATSVQALNALGAEGKEIIVQAINKMEVGTSATAAKVYTVATLGQLHPHVINEKLQAILAGESSINQARGILASPHLFKKSTVDKSASSDKPADKSSSSVKPFDKHTTSTRTDRKVASPAEAAPPAAGAAFDINSDIAKRVKLNRFPYKGDIDDDTRTDMAAFSIGSEIIDSALSTAEINRTSAQRAAIIKATQGYAHHYKTTGDKEMPRIACKLFGLNTLLNSSSMAETSRPSSDYSSTGKPSSRK